MDGIHNPGQSTTGASGGQRTSDDQQNQQNQDQAVAAMTQRRYSEDGRIGAAASAENHTASLQVIVAAFRTRKQILIELHVGYPGDLKEIKKRAATFCCKELDPSIMAIVPEIGARFSFAGREYRSWKCTSRLLQMVDLSKIKEESVSPATWSIDIANNTDLLRCAVSLFKKGSQDKIADLALEVETKARDDRSSSRESPVNKTGLAPSNEFPAWEQSQIGDLALHVLNLEEKLKQAQMHCTKNEKEIAELREQSRLMQEELEGTKERVEIINNRFTQVQPSDS